MPDVDFGRYSPRWQALLIRSQLRESGADRNRRHCQGFAMKRYVVAVLILLASIGSANAQSAREAEAQSAPLAKLAQPILLAPPSNLPDIAQCRGILSQLVLDIVNNANEDPADTFEKNRRAHPHMIM